MNSQYRFDLSVTDPNGKTARRSFIVDAFEAPALKPYDVCSEPLMAMLAGGVTERGAARIDSDRTRLVKEIALNLADSILSEIKQADTKNGYAQ